MSIFLGTRRISTRLFRFIVAVVSTFLLFQFVSLYLSWPKQIVVGGVSIVVAMLLNRFRRSEVVTLSLMLISLAATLRYGWWRIHMIVLFFTDESNNRLTVASVLMLVLVSAEAYTIFIMVLGFMQTARPLRRKPIPLPADEALWPDVDVLIPTYNEPLSLVRYTALAAINVDYPPEKLHVYVLDDGTREEFHTFCEEAGVGYIVRKEHGHAKAGNINHALTLMHSPLVTIFDCDHVPTRSFLQVTLGWFLAEPKLAMLQTPHFFYSPDPFERNLYKYKAIPNEGELFYGVIQDGNDLWNATFFCGSCAVIRRAALDEVGGIATETVTEDAHTSLRMQKHGWNTAYINLPQAAGLATETLAAHVGQRVRWARGMIQIFRTDNPMLASGMKFSQRLCYFNAMLHFLYAVPRLIFLCAPLVYMLAGMTIIPGYWVAILAYALPHLILSSLTNSRVQGKHRHSFWNEIYETVLAPYILLPTLLALINPKLGKFNVTDKGSTLSETTYDRHIAAPTTWLLALNFIGVCVVPYRLTVTDPTHPGTVISNLVWILFNMVILGVAAAVANEQKQRRTSVRIPVNIPVRLRNSEGTVWNGITQDMSVGGAQVTLSSDVGLTLGDNLRLSFPNQTGEDEIGASVVGLRGTSLRLNFAALDIVEQETLTCALYSRADSWIKSRSNVENDRPLLSFARVVRLSFTGFYQVLHGLLPRRKKAITATAVLALLLATGSLAAQIPGAVGAGSPAAQPNLQPNLQPSPQPDSQPAASAAAPDAATPSVPAQAAAASTPTSTTRQAATLYVPDTPPVADLDANDRITLKDMGVNKAIDMRGPHSFYSEGFVLSHTRLPKRATLNLTYHFSSALAPHTGSIKVTVNGTPIAEIAAPDRPQRDGEYAFVSLPVPAELLIRNNDLTFEFTGGTLLQTEQTTHAAILGNVGATSTLLIVSDPIPFRNDLGLLPLPIFDTDLQSATTIPFVFLSPPSPKTLQAASIVASWLGILASTRQPHFSVSIGTIPKGNVIVFANGSAGGTPLPAELRAPTAGQSLSIKVNPSDPDGSALVLAGDDDSQLLNVARSLALMTVHFLDPGVTNPTLGDTVQIGDFPLPNPRGIDDAPRWLSTERLTSLWALSSKEALQSDGSKSLPLYFRVPPDINYGENQNLNLQLTYRYNAVPLAPGSALRTYVNGTLINEAPLVPGTDYADRRRAVILPVANMRPFANTLLFNFDFIPRAGFTGTRDQVHQLAGSILRNSYLDIRGMAHWADMPNLELFANAGFPFTRRADLAETVVIVPQAPTAKEIALLLYLMSHCGAQTGYPALRVEIAGPDAVIRPDRDYLILGGVSDQPAFAALDSALPATLDINGIHIKPITGYLSPIETYLQQASGYVKHVAGYFTSLQGYWAKLTGAIPASLAPNPVPSNEGGPPDLMIEGIESPYTAGRSIVVVALHKDDAVDSFADIFLERNQSSDISQSLSLLRAGQFSSYTMETHPYHVGDIDPYPLLRLWLTQHFWLLLTTVTFLSLILARYARDYLNLLSAERLSADPNFHQP